MLVDLGAWFAAVHSQCTQASNHKQTGGRRENGAAVPNSARKDASLPPEVFQLFKFAYRFQYMFPPE